MCWRCSVEILSRPRRRATYGHGCMGTTSQPSRRNGPTEAGGPARCAANISRLCRCGSRIARDKGVPMSKNPTRRDVLAAAATSSLVARAAAPAKPALLGGKPVRATQFPSWPMIEENDERQWMDVLKSKRWNRMGGSYVQQFEKMWAEQLGAKHCLATANGTTSL